MLSADEIRKKMPSRTPATKEEFLSAIEKRAVDAAKQGAISIWINAKDGYKETPTAAFEQALNILRAKGYRLVEDTHQGKPALRIYWEDEPAKSEWEIQTVPRTRKGLIFHVLNNAVVGAVFFGLMVYMIVAVANLFRDSQIDINNAAINFAAIGFFVVGSFAWFFDTGEVIRKKKEAN